MAWSYAVLAAAGVFEGISWYYGFKAFRVERRGRGVLETIRGSKNPASFAVVLEDSAALIGLALAGAGIFLATRLERPSLDVARDGGREQGAAGGRPRPRSSAWRSLLRSISARRT